MYKFLVYKICHPKTLKCVWVGMTTDAGNRFSNHTSGNGGNENRQKTKWVKSLKSKNLKPLFIIDSWHATKSAARNAECELMHKQHSKLFNEVKEVDFTPTGRRPVLDQTGKFYRSILDASNETGCPRKGILATLTGAQKQTKGFIFMVAK